MDLTRSTQAAAAKPAQTVLPENERRNAIRNVEGSRKPSGYGMPCASCRLYYAAELESCPTCNSKERVSATAVPAVPRTQAAAEPVPDTEVLEQEREAFLKEFKSQLFAAHAEVASASVVCSLGEHAEDAEPASICKPCYDRLQERVDVFEAALHIDLKEAAQIVYDAVWADPSDPSKTYANAAGALISELRKRSGASSLLGPFQPLGN
jgi:hypothetical protein